MLITMGEQAMLKFHMEIVYKLTELPSDRVYAELLKLRSMVAERGGTPLPTGKASIDGNIMSTVFAVVLVLILSVSVYAFINLYRALYKRFTTPP